MAREKAITTLESMIGKKTIRHKGRSDFRPSTLTLVSIDPDGPPDWRLVFADQCTSVGRSVAEITRSKRMAAAEAEIQAGNESE